MRKPADGLSQCVISELRVSLDKELDSVQRRELLQIEVTKPNGTIEVIDALGVFRVRMYMKDYEERGCKVRML